MTVGLLGLQGAFLDHIRHLRYLGAEARIIRDAGALRGIRRLVIPGGESTVMGKFLEEFNMAAPLRECIAQGLPVWGVCAGAVLLAETVDGCWGRLRALSMSVVRNAYGRHWASTEGRIDVSILDAFGGQGSFPAIFIRSPRIAVVGPDMAVHARFGHDPVFVQQGRVMATTFHPELTPDPVFHRYFLSL